MSKHLHALLMILITIIVVPTPLYAKSAKKKTFQESSVVHHKMYFKCISENDKSIKLETDVDSTLNTKCGIILVELVKKKTTNAKISAYNAEKSQNGPQPYLTASGIIVCEGIVAVSRDLFKSGWTFGKYVIIDGKYFIIADVMGSGAKQHIDVFMWSKKDAYDWGVRRHTVTLLEKIEKSS